MLTTTLKRAAAGAAGLSLAFTGAAVLAAPAQAAEVTTDYNCTTPLTGTTLIPMKVTTSATSSSGGKIDFNTKVSAGTFSDAFRAIADSIAGTATSTFDINGAKTVVEMTIPTTTTAGTGDLVISATGQAAVSPVINTVVGDSAFVTNMQLTKAGKTDALQVNCVTANGSTPNLGSVDARAKTTTAVTLSSATASVGGEVKATAKVTGATGGSFDFVVAGKTTNVAVAADGSAVFTLPAATAAGAVDVVANYVPANAAVTAPSTAKATVTYAKAKSTTTVTFAPATALVGDAVNAVAKVVGPDGKALAGSVDFVVNGVTTNMALAADGTATMAMAKPTTGGTVAVTVNYKPANAAGVEASSATGNLTVGAVSTTTKAMAKKTVKFGKVAKVTGMVSTPNAAVVSGKAMVTVKAKGMKAKKVKGNVVAGKVVFKVKKLMKGKYTAQVSYMGVSGSFSPSKSSRVKFTVK